MAYPENCFVQLVGIHGTCEPQQAMYWLDDIPGIDITKLANVAEASAPTGEKLAAKLLESAARMMIADVEAIYDAKYKVVSSLLNGCSVCKFTTTYATGPNNGIAVKYLGNSSLSKILIDKLTVKVNSTGTYHILIDDGVAENLRTIENEFTAGEEVEFVNLNYKTSQKKVKIYFQENDVLMAQLSCPRSGSGCGCSGASKVDTSDLQFIGMTNGAETQQAYGFIPCAGIVCDAADLLCFIANSAPRMVGMALMYKTAELYFNTRLQSARNNKTVGTMVEETKEDVKKYAKAYTDRLNGVGVSGIKDVVFTTLQAHPDDCVACNSLLGTAWATG